VMARTEQHPKTPARTSPCNPIRVSDLKLGSWERS
jgi:hypothetical protein